VLGRFQTSKVTFEVIQGHWYWCHSIGHIQFPISLPLQLISQDLKRLHDLNTSPVVVIYHTCTGTQCLSAHA